MMSSSKFYSKVLLSEKINVPFKSINSDINTVLQKIIKNKIEGICINEGYVKPDSVNLISYSTGELYANYVQYDIIYECLIANTVESMIIDCIVKSITKVGLRAELNESISPFIIFIARDHHFENELFSKIKENDIINVRVLGQRYELNNRYISVIAELVDINNSETLKTELKSIDGGKIKKRFMKKVTKKTNKSSKNSSILTDG
tara:strand:- start:8304 stop:8918 length:615 start_codon:yes stop_codon:yes gene_type:complete